MSPFDEVRKEQFTEPGGGVDIDRNHGHVLLHGALTGEISLSTESGIVDEIINRPVILPADIIDLLCRLWNRKISSNRVNFHTILFFYSISLFIEFFLAASHKDESTAISSMDIYKAGAKPAI